VQQGTGTRGSAMGSLQNDITERRDGYLSVNETKNVSRGHLRHVSETPLINDESEECDNEYDCENSNVIDKQNEDVIESLDLEEKEKIPHGILKTLLMFVWMCTGMVVTTIALIVTNERHEYTRPLPDLLLDSVAYQPAGVSISEMIMVVTILMSFCVTMAHAHRSIILRRVFFIVGLMYFYRAITMSVTVLPKPDPHWDCPKQNTTLTAYDIYEKLKSISGHGGISLGEKQLFCGDYIFSGHTMCLILSYLVVKEYGPPKIKLLHWLSYTMFLAGIIALLTGRGHYTIDVILGYWVLTRVWSIYHALVDSRGKETAAERHLREGVWWDKVLDFLEAGIHGPLPSRYTIPLPVFIKSRVIKMFIRNNGNRNSAQYP